MIRSRPHNKTGTSLVCYLYQIVRGDTVLQSARLVSHKCKGFGRVRLQSDLCKNSSTVRASSLRLGAPGTICTTGMSCSTTKVSGFCLQSCISNALWHEPVQPYAGSLPLAVPTPFSHCCNGSHPLCTSTA